MAAPQKPIAVARMFWTQNITRVDQRVVAVRDVRRPWRQTQGSGRRGLTIVEGRLSAGLCRSEVLDVPLDGGKGEPQRVPRWLTADEIREWIVNWKEMAAKHKATRKPPMPDYSKVPTGDVDALVAFLPTLK